MPDIVVTGTRYGGSWSDFELPSGMFSAFYIVTPYFSSTVGDFVWQRTDLTLPASPTAHTPKLVMENVTAAEFAVLAGAIANSGKDPELAASFREMQEMNVTLRVHVVQDAPAGFLAGEQARITITATGASATGPDHFYPNSTVDIVIVASRVDATGLNDLGHVVAHELSHLIRDASGEFLQDFGPGQTAHTREATTFHNLFSTLVTTNYIDSIDVVTVTTAYNQTTTYGTAGNNLFDLGDGDNTVYTGSGNDIVATGPGNDLIYVNGTGMKIVSDTGAGYDCIFLDNIPSAADLRLTIVGYDLYLNNRWSGFSPVDDPNAIVLLDWRYYNGMDSVEFARFPNGDIIGLWGDNNGTPGGGGYGAALSEDSMLAASALDGLTLVAPQPTTIWDVMQVQSFTVAGPLQSRYDGITEYLSFTIDTANPAFAQLESTASMMSSAIFDGGGQPSFELDLYSAMREPLMLQTCDQVCFV